MCRYSGELFIQTNIREGVFVQYIVHKSNIHSIDLYSEFLFDYSNKVYTF